MKFGKRMRMLMDHEWEHDYVDYKVLKKQLKHLPCNASSSEAASSKEDLALVVLQLLTQQFDRINNAHDRFVDRLDSQLHALRNQLGSKWVLKPCQARSLLMDGILLCDRIDAFRRFLVLNTLAIVKITKKVDKLFASHHHHQQNSQLQDQEQAQEREVNQQQHQHNHSELLIATPTIRTTVIESLREQTFFQGDRLQVLGSTASKLMDRIMLRVLPDGDFHLDLQQTQCPICLNKIKSPITLSCDHTFCWTCLAKAVEQRFHACPMCRKVQSIDPRDYAVDGLLKRFERVYQVVHQRLDLPPLVASPMHQILAEAFDFVHELLMEVEAKYCNAMTSNLSSPTADANSTSSRSGSNQDGHRHHQPTALTAQPSSEPKEKHQILGIGDTVEVHDGATWQIGVVLQCHPDGTLAVMWWRPDNSQRFAQRKSRREVRLPQRSEAKASHLAMADGAFFGTAREALLSMTKWVIGVDGSTSSNEDLVVS